jgi:hypothetical protein
LCGLGISLLGSSLGPEWRKASFKWFLLCSSPCIAMVPAQQQCPALMLEDDRVVRGSTWRAAIWSCSRVRASISYVERARALYRPAAANWDQAVKLRDGHTGLLLDQYGRSSPSRGLRNRLCTGLSRRRCVNKASIWTP